MDQAHLDAVLSLLVDARDLLVAEQGRVWNRLRALLLGCSPGLQASTGVLITEVALARARSLALRARGAEPVRAQLALAALRRITALDAEINAMDGSIAELKARHPHENLLAITGVGPLVAAKIVGETHDGRHFREAAAFAHAGAAPIPAFSGNTIRHRLARGGNRHSTEPFHRRYGPGPLATRRPGLPHPQTGQREDGRRGATLPQTAPRCGHLSGEAQGHHPPDLPPPRPSRDHVTATARYHLTRAAPHQNALIRLVGDCRRRAARRVDRRPPLSARHPHPLSHHHKHRGGHRTGAQCLTKRRITLQPPNTTPEDLVPRWAGKRSEGPCAGVDPAPGGPPRPLERPSLITLSSRLKGDV